MTTQITEVLILGRKKHSMASLPLEDYREAGGTLPYTRTTCSGLWRGYVGTWAVRRGRLYLVDIDTTQYSTTDLKLHDFFPGCGERVFAEWFSDTLRLPQGEMLMYLPGGVCGGIHEEDLLLTFERGVLVKREVKKNVVTPGLRSFFFDD